MNKNSYVTAALFVVFVLLTVFYYSLDNKPEESAASGVNGSNPPIQTEVKETDAQSGAELASEDESGEETTTTAANGESTTEESTSIQVLRTELAKQQSQQVSELKSIIASKDYDAETKSEAKDNLEKINSNDQHRSALEAMIKAKGYSDVLVRVNEDTVQVLVQVETQEEVPTSLEVINELHMMAKTEFATNPDVSVNFQALD